jgi:predicted O-linked N-acetylglucosamine transferase (SPINDLY family)
MQLPDNVFIFCCFNNSYKINPTVFKIWMQILTSVKPSILWLYEDNIWVRDNLIREARIHNIDQDRIIFGRHLPHTEHLSRYQHADLFLDTWPCNAHTTASDALRSGLPLITLCGKSFASRVGASLLNTVGLPELITYNEDEYKKLAFELATDNYKLLKTKEKLQNNINSSNLINTTKYTKNLEKGYKIAFQNFKSGKSPENIIL